MAVPYTFGTATAAIPLSNLDSNFATTITLGNTAIQLGNTVTTLNNMTLANVTVSSGNVTLTNVAITTANVTTANIGTAVITGTSTLTGLTASTALALDASKNIVSVTNTGSGNNVLGTSPTIATPTISTITSAASTALTLQSNNGNTAVTVDTSQNVGIGTTAPAQKVHIQQTSSGASLTQLVLQNQDNAAGTASAIGFANHSNSGLITQKIEGYVEGSNAYSMRFYTYETTLKERMRIDSSGNVLVAQTSQTGSEKFGVTQSATGSSAVRFYASSASYVNNIVEISCARSGATTEYNAFTVFDNNTTLKMLIRPNGNLLNANNSYGSLSDVSLKENIVDATPKLDGLMQVKVRNYNLKDDVNKTKQIGVIAQELETVFPGMIETDGKGIKAVKYSVFVPMLLKAIQEQQALITSLTDRIAALEAK
jgi:hypothetical protein